MTDLNPAVLKLAALELRARELLGASLHVSEHRTELANVRLPLRRELDELAAWVAKPYNQGAQQEARLERLTERMAYLDSAINAAAARFEVLNAQAAAAKSTAEKVREHLGKTLDSGGFEP